MFVLAVSILSIVNLVLLRALRFQSPSWWRVIYIDTTLTIIFVSDFTTG